MHSPKPRIAFLLALLILIGLLCVPVSAGNYTMTNNLFILKDVKTYNEYGVTSVDHDARDDDRRISLVKFHIPKNAKLDFTLYYGTGSTVAGSFESEPSEDPLRPGFFYTTETYTLGTDTRSYTFWDSEYEDVALSGYAKTNEEIPQTGFIAYSLEYGSLDNDLAVFYPVANISANTIYRITATCDKPFDIEITDGTPSDVAGGASKGLLDVAWEWINLAISLATTVKDAVLMLFSIIKFFFIDNLLVSFMLYFSVSMAYAAISSGGNIFRFYRNFFKFQRSFLSFLMEIWNYFVQIISAFRSIFRI